MIRGIVTGATESRKAMIMATDQGLDELEKRVAAKSDIGDLKGQTGDRKGDTFKYICMPGFVTPGPWPLYPGSF